MKIFAVFFIVFFIMSWVNAQEQETTCPYQNPDLSIETRVDDLLNRLTLEEKVSQMMNQTPGIKRLGIPPYDWWNEALHGVARAGRATVFPQAIALAATFDDRAVYETFSIISDEARAKYNHFQANNEYERYKGLTFWTPNINIFRDPRWGRGMETYGEDPYLTSRMGVAVVKGLQGDDPKYYKTHACAKHFAVHSGPEWNRHEFNAEVTKRDLRETYLPAFEALIKEGNVQVKNTGAYDGDEVVQVYCTQPANVADAPLQSLVAFKRINIKKGETETVDFEIPVARLRHFDSILNKYVVAKGQYNFNISSASNDIRETAQFIVE